MNSTLSHPANSSKIPVCEKTEGRVQTDSKQESVRRKNNLSPPSTRFDKEGNATGVFRETFKGGAAPKGQPAFGLGDLVNEQIERAEVQAQLFWPFAG